MSCEPREHPGPAKGAVRSIRGSRGSGRVRRDRNPRDAVQPLSLRSHSDFAALQMPGARRERTNTAGKADRLAAAGIGPGAGTETHTAYVLVMNEEPRARGRTASRSPSHDAGTRLIKERAISMSSWLRSQTPQRFQPPSAALLIPGRLRESRRLDVGHPAYTNPFGHESLSISDGNLAVLHTFGKIRAIKNLTRLGK